MFPPLGRPDNILAACYYAEFVEGRPDFGVPDVEELLTTGRIPQPQNLPRDLKTLLDRKLLNRVKGTSGPSVQYVLTNLGTDEVVNLNSAAGREVLWRRFVLHFRSLLSTSHRLRRFG